MHTFTYALLPQRRRLLQFAASLYDRFEIIDADGSGTLQITAAWPRTLRDTMRVGRWGTTQE